MAAGQANQASDGRELSSRSNVSKPPRRVANFSGLPRTVPGLSPKSRVSQDTSQPRINWDGYHPSAHCHRRILESGAVSPAAEQMIRMTTASEFLLFLETV